MTKEELNNWIEKWDLKPIEAAKVLKIQRSKMSEYLSGAREKIPEYITAHIETFEELSKAQAKKLIKKRLA